MSNLSKRIFAPASTAITRGRFAPYFAPTPGHCLIKCCAGKFSDAINFLLLRPSSGIIVVVAFYRIEECHARI